MSSTTRQIPPSEWDRHKATIVELYRKKTLKDVRAEMQSLHGFNASSSQYEMQLKRWNIRKNATQKEWQQYFSNNEHRSIPTSIDASGTTVPDIILSKSTASKKRASRWVPGSLVEPSASQASAATLPRNVARPIAASVSDEQLALEPGMRPDIQDLFINVADVLDGFGSVPRHTDPLINSMVTSYEPLAGSSQACFDAMGGPGQSLDLNPTSFHVLSSPAAREFQALFLRQDCSVESEFTSLGIPAENNVTFFSMLQGTDFKRELPSAQLEHILRFKGIVLDKAAANYIFGGFAPRFVAGILSSKDQSMVRQTPNLQHFLRKLGSQVPGESSALITDDQAFETKFARVLLFSILNGFAGLDDLPMENILRFLNRFVVNKILLDILERCPRHVSRTLADNIFRAAIEATDTKVVKLLLDRRLVDVNETVCFHRGEKRTPIQQASGLIASKLMQALIDAGADVNKSYVNEDPTHFNDRCCGALGSLIYGIESHLRNDGSAIPPESIEAFKILVAFGVRIHPNLMFLDELGRTKEFDLFISQNVPSKNHRGFFEDESREYNPEESLLERFATLFDDRSATIFVRTVMSLCHEAGCNKCVVDFINSLQETVLLAAETGKIELVQLLLDKVDLEAELPRIFVAAIESQNQALIDLILSHDPDPDPPAIHFAIQQDRPATTPIAEAVRYGNRDLIRKLEEGGSLNQLAEGDRFEALIFAAAEAGNTACMRKLLTRAVTSKEAYRIMGEPLACAFYKDHEDVVQMLLEAGASAKARKHNNYDFIESPIRSNPQIVRDLIAAGAYLSHIEFSNDTFAREDLSRTLDLVHEYPELKMVGPDLFQTVVSVCSELEALDFFKEVYQTLRPETLQLETCLIAAVKHGLVDLVGYLLDMGANPINDEVLEAVIPDRPDILRLLFQTERPRQTIPKCIGAKILLPVMGNGAGNAEALDGLIRTEAINFARLEVVPVNSYPRGFRQEYFFKRFTPLGLAIQGVDGEFDTNMVAMKQLLDAGADPDGISRFHEEYTQGSPLMTALMVAIETGREDAVNMLLDHGADVNARPCIRTTRTALQYAAELGNMDMVRLLLSRGADMNSSASSHGGATALQFAVMSGNCNMVAYLLDHGAQLDALPSRIDGMWPLEGAAANGRLDMIRYLWELNVRAVAGGTFPDGFSERHCLRAMNFAREHGHIGCRDLISELSGISVDRLETDEYGAPWIAY